MKSFVLDWKKHWTKRVGVSSFSCSTKTKVTNYKQAINCNTEQFNKFYHGMLEQGVYLAPASYEAGFVSKAHDAAVIEQTLAAADKVFSTL